MTTNEEIKIELDERKVVAMRLWDTYAHVYSSLIPEYEALLEKKKKLHIKAWPLKKAVLRSLPDIPFLKMEENEAMAYLERLNLLNLNGLIVAIELAAESPVWRIIAEWNKDSRHQIRRYGIKPAFFGYRSRKLVEEEVEE